MSTTLDAEWGRAGRRPAHVPAYGPVDAALGYGLFYVVVERATPTVVAALADRLPGLSPDVVGLGLAGLLWFVLAVTVLDQGRRQLAALGIVDGPGRPRPGTRPVPTEAQAVGYLLTVVGGGLVAAWTFELAIDTLVVLVATVATLDVTAVHWPGTVAVPWPGVVALVVFMVAFGVGAHAADRLVIGGLRRLLAG